MEIAGEVFTKVWRQPRLFFACGHRESDRALVYTVVYVQFYIDWHNDLSFNIFNRLVQKKMKPDEKFFDRVRKTAQAVADKVRERLEK